MLRMVCTMKTIVVTSMGFEDKVVAMVHEWAVVSCQSSPHS